MSLSGIKLVATDMDGTLLDADHELPRDFFSVFDQLKKRGILFAAASGRQLYNLQNKFAAVQDEMAFIAENGSHVVYKGKDIFVQAMDPETVKELIIVARGIPGINIILSGKNCGYLENTNAAFMEHVTMYYDKRQIVEDLLEVKGDEFLKIAICDLRGSEKNSLPHFIKYQDSLQVKVSGHIWLDLSHKQANKGNALRILQEKTAISEKQTLVFGDYLNDLEMMQQAYFSYAMENAHEEVKKVSRFLAKSNLHNGVEIVLKEMLALNILHPKE